MFFAPAGYFIRTRLDGGPAVISWLMIYPVPIALSVVVTVGAPDPGQSLALLLAMLVTYALYEVGYMDNDTRTVRHESAPTDRLDDREKAFFARRWPGILAVRLGFVVGGCAAIWMLEGYLHRGILTFYLGLIAIAVIFPLYNSVRGRVNLPLHFVLVTCRFCLPGLVLVPSGLPAYLAMMVVAFPMINLLERSGEARYRLPAFSPILEQRTLSRIVYYLVAMVIATLLWITGRTGVAPTIMFGYFLGWRVASPGALALFARTGTPR